MQFLSSCMLNEELTATCLPPQDLGLQGCFFDISLLFVRYTIERHGCLAFDRVSNEQKRDIEKASLKS